MLAEQCILSLGHWAGIAPLYTNKTVRRRSSSLNTIQINTTLFPLNTAVDRNPSTHHESVAQGGVLLHRCFEMEQLTADFTATFMAPLQRMTSGNTMATTNSHNNYHCTTTTTTTPFPPPALTKTVSIRTRVIVHPVPLLPLHLWYHQRDILRARQRDNQLLKMIAEGPMDSTFMEAHSFRGLETIPLKRKAVEQARTAVWDAQDESEDMKYIRECYRQAGGVVEQAEEAHQRGIRDALVVHKMQKEDKEKRKYMNSHKSVNSSSSKSRKTKRSQVANNNNNNNEEEDTTNVSLEPSERAIEKLFSSKSNKKKSSSSSKSNNLNNLEQPPPTRSPRKGLEESKATRRSRGRLNNDRRQVLQDPKKSNNWRQSHITLDSVGGQYSQCSQAEYSQYTTGTQMPNASPVPPTPRRTAPLRKPSNDVPVVILSSAAAAVVVDEAPKRSKNLFHRLGGTTRSNRRKSTTQPVDTKSLLTHATQDTQRRKKKNKLLRLFQSGTSRKSAR